MNSKKVRKALKFTVFIIGGIVAGIVIGDFIGIAAFQLFHPSTLPAEIAAQEVLWKRVGSLVFAAIFVPLAIRRARLSNWD